MPSALDHHQDVLKAHGYHPLPVKAVTVETVDAKTFVFDVPPELAPTFVYRPGQFCTLRTRIGNEEFLRSYSMSSAPETDPDLAVTVKRVADGLVSNWLNDHVRAGDILDVSRPAGVFCPREGPAPLVAFCGGSGVTPVMSVAKSVLSTTDRAVRLIYANRTRDSIIFEDALRVLSERTAGRLDVRYHFDSERGFLEPGDVISSVEDVLDGDFYICGPGPFMDLVEAAVLDRGVDSERVLIERFNIEDPRRPSPEPAATDERRAAQTVTVVLKGRPTTARYVPGDTLLETARRAGLQPPFSCEAGNCATCMAYLKEGTVRMRANNVLTPEEIEEGWVLTCQSLPTSETVTVEYESL